MGEADAIVLVAIRLVMGEADVIVAIRLVMEGADVIVIDVIAADATKCG
jgi:hypothetical protein